ncbi:tetratricopeptide repeat protein [Parasediminibacterium sp. JCM 36343]|uniref:tetratricopeptide repeat protein n=1 Tax=Parasediminibacterium sp. JCM 36343 TaxID=3374279 RepID=UPI00397A6CB5
MPAKLANAFYFTIATFLLASCADVASVRQNKQAYTAIENKQYGEAIEICKQNIKDNPKNPFAYNIMASALSEMGNNTLALEKLDAAIKIAPKYSYSYYQLGYIASSMKEDAKALEAYNKCIALNKKFACAYNNRAIVKERLNLHDEALQDYDSCLTLEEALHCTAYANEAFIYANRYNYTKALALIDKSIQKDPDQLSQYRHLKNNISESKLLDQAKAGKWDTSIVNKLLRYGDAYSVKGFLKIGLGRYDEAAKCFEYNRKIPGIYALTWCGKGYIAAFENKEDSAFAYLSKAILMNPENDFAYYLRGRLFEKTGNWEAAKNDMDSAIHFSENDAAAYLCRGKCYLASHNTQEAIADFTNAIQKTEYPSAAYNARGYAYFLSGQYQEAAKDDSLSKATAQKWQQPFYGYGNKLKNELGKGKKTSNITIAWQCPVYDVNDLADSGRLYVKESKDLYLSLSVASDKPIVPGHLFLMQNGQSLYSTPDTKMVAVKENKAVGENQYSYSRYLHLNKGIYTIWLSYEGEDSQKLTVVVE